MSLRVTLLWLLTLSLLPLAAPAAQDSPTPDPAATVAATDETPFAPPVWVSPTPDAAGTLAVVVQPGESMWVIAARAGLTLQQLLDFNNLTESAIISPGDVLIIGYATPAAPPTPAEEAPPTATRPPPTPRPTDARPVATICLSAFDDVDQDGVFDDGEALRAGVAFTVYTAQAVVANYITDGVSEPKCIRDLSPGEYRVTRSITPGEALTTSGDWALNLAAGSTLYQSFGSYMGPAAPAATRAGGAAVRPTTALAEAAPAAAAPAAAPAEAPSDESGSFAFRLASVLLLFAGGLLMLLAVLILLWRQLRRRPEGRSEPVEPERRFRNIDDLE